MIINEKQLLMILSILHLVGTKMFHVINSDSVMKLYEEILNQQSNELIEVK